MDSLSRESSQRRQDLIIYFENAGALLLLITVFLISYPRSWSLYPLAGFLICGLFLWFIDYKNLKRSLEINWIVVALPVIYFLLHLLSALFSRGSMKLMEIRMMFILIPLFGYPLFVSGRFSNLKSLFFRVFVYGMISISLFLVINAILKALRDLPSDLSIFKFIVLHKYRFFSSDFSVIEHPTYLSMKIIWAIVLISLSPSDMKMKGISKWFITLFFSIVIMLLASRASIILLVVIILFIISSQVGRGKLPLLAGMILMIIFTMAIFFASLRITRVNELAVKFKTAADLPVRDWKNFDQRTREWFTAIQLINDYPVFGTGLGRFEEKMVEKYKQYGFTDEAKLRMNAHNQFLEAQATFGIAGTVILLAMLFMPVFYKEVVRDKKLFLLFVCLFSFFLLFESMFNRQWGIMFFLLFYNTLLLNKWNSVSLESA